MRYDSIYSYVQYILQNFENNLNKNIKSKSIVITDIIIPDGVDYSEELFGNAINHFFDKDNNLIIKFWNSLRELSKSIEIKKRNSKILYITKTFVENQKNEWLKNAYFDAFYAVWEQQKISKDNSLVKALCIYQRRPFEDILHIKPTIMTENRTCKKPRYSNLLFENDLALRRQPSIEIIQKDLKEKLVINGNALGEALKILRRRIRSDSYFKPDLSLEVAMNKPLFRKRPLSKDSKSRSDIFPSTSSDGNLDSIFAKYVTKNNEEEEEEEKEESFDKRTKKIKKNLSDDERGPLSQLTRKSLFSYKKNT